ncbi:ABC transporter substrate-binding protein [Streptococcus oralis]|uniref:Metal ABC transporter substrate-binding protein n=1 Tax=Streptococcus oralis subsp. tigurinus TaxID=1077464 RepID=A0A1X0WNT1_STROR|nr:ABC transporter substrate-binding protein [Streptococcus oralis]ORJ28440.1 metal ABC transporter substrate-binding protein [Streptococcus oralis subsp. tigurinus]
MKKTLSILLVTVATLTMAACGNTTTEKATTQSSTETSQKASTETTYPLTVKTYDAKGHEVEQVFDKAPEKVITNNLSTTEILLELGLKDKIAGMLNPDNAVTGKYKDAIATIPQIGDKKTVSQETVLSYEPDAVMGRNMMFSEKSLGTVSTWNENKIPVYTQKASLSTIQQDLGNIVEDVKNLGMIFNVQDKANEYAAQLQAKIEAVKKANPASQGEKKKALIMVAYNDETFGTYKSALQESLLNQLGYTNVATGTSGLTLENLVSMDPELIIYVTSDRNKKLDANAVELMKANEVLENVPAIKNQKIMTISYDELMDYGPAVIDSLEKINDFINK